MKPRRHNPWWRVVILGLLMSLASATAQDVSDEDVRQYIVALQAHLVQAQQADGSWDYRGYEVGITALVLQALLRSGLPGDHPAVTRAAAFIERHRDKKTYSEGLVPAALELLDQNKYRQRQQAAMDFLVEAEQNGTWSYTRNKARGDNSNAQFAALGLAAAERAGIRLPANTREAAIDHWRRSQNRDGGWAYTGVGGSSTVAMTCAGIASLQQLGLQLARREDCCGKYRYEPEMSAGLKWLGGALRRGMPNDPYALYAIERVGIFLGIKRIGGVDWYRAGANQIIRQRLGRGALADMALTLLFLARGSAPIAIAKWEWSGDWNNQLYDVQNWTRYAADDLDQQLDWLSAPLDALDSPAAKASLLYLSGRDVFQVTDDELDVLRAFLDAEGTLVAEATCDSLDFYETFRNTMLDRLCPEYSPRFEPVEEGHPLLTAHFQLSPKEVAALRFQAGCKQYRIILLNRPIGCALNGDQNSQPDLPRARQVATNLLAWSFQRKEARFKLDAVTLKPQADTLAALTPDQVERLSSRQGRAYHHPFGRLRHRGQWLAAPRFFAVMQSTLAKIPEAVQFDAELYLSPASQDLYQCATTFMTGYDRPSLTEAELVSLRDYLQRGGFLLASAACSSEQFDEGFRQLLGRLLPADELEQIPADDPLWNLTYPLSEQAPNGTAAYHQLHGNEWAPLYGIRREGRWLLVYSPTDFCSDMGSPLHDAVPGYRADSAWPLVTNILHYAMTP